jgi:hypothetical protein
VYGVTLGVTTKQQLERLATRATDIDPGTGKEYPFYYIYHGKFYWNDAGVATSMVVTQYWDFDPTPEEWQRLGWNWSLSYNSWISLLRQQGYSITIEESPRLIKDKDRDTFLAKISAVKRTRIPLKITLIFDRHKSVFRRGTTADSNYTLDTIKVEVL